MKSPTPPNWLLLTGLFLLASPALAQPSFLEATPTADPYFVTPAEEDFWVNAVAPADVDLDGDLDLAVIGYYVIYNVSADDRLMLFLNQGPDAEGRWLFTDVQVPLGALSSGASDLVWGDYDGDGDDDLTVGSEGATVIYRNDAGVLTALPNVLPPYAEDSTYNGAYDLRSLSWVDFDNDGDLDLFIPSVWNPELTLYSSAMLRNDGADGSGGWTFTDAVTGIDPAVHAHSTWADEDGDGDLDLLLANIDAYTETAYLRLFRNQNGTFVGSAMLDVNELVGLADWADADGDGDLDVLVVGNLLEPDQTYNTVLRVYRNDGASGHTAITLVDAPNVDWLDLHAATWADYDSDGDVDILVTGNFIGNTEIEGHSKVFVNEGGTWSVLPLELPAPISSIGQGGAFTWLDLDGDGDLDYLVSGAYYVPNGNGLVESKIVLFSNQATTPNQPPSAPTGLATTPLAGGVRLTWNPAIDDHTGTAALTYDLEVRRQGTSATDAMRLPEPGNLSQAASWTLKNLAPGTYQYSLCAIDSAYTAGNKIQGTFTVAGAAEIFANGFESGTTAGWSLTVP